MMWRWYRWQATTVGQASGNIRSLPFIRFRREQDMIDWVFAHNLTKEPDPLVLYGYERIGDGQ